MIFSEYLSSICSKKAENDSLWLAELKSTIESKMKESVSHWKWKSISSAQKQLTSFLRACDGLWSDRYGESHSWTGSSSSQSWSFIFEEQSWMKILSVKAAGESRLFCLVEMPKKLFVTRDLLHWRYHDKRKIFLSVLGWCLTQSGHFDHVQIVPWAIGKPLLRLRLDKQFDIFLFPCAPKDTFQSEKILKKKALAWNGHSDYYYRTTILEDILLESVFQQVTQAEESHMEWKHVVHFFQNWYSTFKRKDLFMESEDIFLMSIWFMISFIVTKDMHWKRLDCRRLVEYCFHILDCQVKDILHGERQSVLPLVYLCSFIDFIPFQSFPDDCTVYGELYQLWKGIQYTIRCFEISTQSDWVAVGDWMLCTAFSGEPRSDSDHSLLGLWDMFLSIQLTMPNHWTMLDCLSLCSQCYWILYQALWTRCVYLSVVQISIRGSSCYVLLGCRLNPKNAFVTVEKATNQREQEHFRAFWKEKCELRRYRDGNTYESLVWKQEEENDIPLESLFHRICDYALAREIPLVKREQIQIFCDVLESLLPCKSFSSSLPWVVGLERLVNQLRKWEDLPFDIHNVCIYGDMFRGTSVILPDVWQNQAIFQHIDAPRAILVVENNIQWPMDDREAQKMMRIGYCLALGKYLQDKGIESCADERGLDVVFEDYIYHFEIWMLQEYQQEEAMTRETAIAIQLHYHLKYMTEKETNQPSFTDACRLAKRWLSCHMFSDYFADEVIELLVARAYIYEMGSLDGDIPCSGFSGFYHFLYVLSLLATQHSNIVVPIPDPHDEPEENVHSWWFIQDEHQISSIYTQQQAHPFYWKLHDRFLFPLYHSTRGIPEWPVLKRIGQVAKATYRTLEQRIMSPDKWNREGLKIVFRPDVSVYDAVIVMHRKYLSRVERYSLDSCKKKYPSAKSVPLDALYVNMDPLEYFVQQLREKLKSFALFFYDKYGGYQIGVLWKPVKRTFSLNHMPFMKPEKGHWQVNYDEILHDIRTMGGPWIKQIKLQDKAH
ncbi:hypothetical protein GpartN1_g5017.t1 [Galdieria partita]|uniref:Uncharacterized protein n=1 Tax=Galdieria partita TaxID=83374 RepID=A0A9C7URT6_9RHOD|nr:hypothetical protein GpartN1_g5017.t1 [Galdieria partita]